MATHQQAEQRAENGFWIHVGCYVAVIAGLAFLNFQRNPDNLWFLWVAGGWGIGILAHAYGFFADRNRLVNRVEARMDRREERKERRENRRNAEHNAAHMTERMSEGSE